MGQLIELWELFAESSNTSISYKLSAVALVLKHVLIELVLCVRLLISLPYLISILILIVLLLIVIRSICKSAGGPEIALGPMI